MYSLCHTLSASNRAAALLQLDKLNKALDDAEMTIKLKPEWEKVNFQQFFLILTVSLNPCNAFSGDAACRDISGREAYWRS